MKPEQKFKAGAISATVWKNQAQKDGKAFSYHSITVERNYKDKDGNWKSANSFRTMDLPKAALVLNKCYEHLSMSQEEIEEIY